MSALRFVPTEWVHTEEDNGAAQIVAQDMKGRRTAIAVPGLRTSVKSLVALIKATGWKVRKVEIHSALSAKGGVVYVGRWFRRRKVFVHAAHAVGLAVQLDAPLWINDQLFGAGFPTEGDADSPVVH